MPPLRLLFLHLARAAACLALLIGPTAHTTAQQQAAPKPLVMAFAELTPWLNRDGTAFTGAYTEILRELARRVGRRLEIQDCPVRRCLAMLEQGQADLTIGLNRTPERAAYLDFLRTPYRLAVADRVFLVRTGESARIGRYEDLLGPRIGVVRGSSYFPTFDTDTRLIKESAPSSEANLQKLVLGRIDAVPLPEDQALVLMHRLKLEGRVEPAKFRVHDPTPRSIAIARASPLATELLPKLEAAMQAIRRDGTLATIYEQHYYRHFGVTRQQIKVD